MLLTKFVRVLIIRHSEYFRLEKPSIVTIGTFDGVHLGHQQILKRLQNLKQITGLQTVVLTFEPHPRSILFPTQTDLKLLTTSDEKLKLLEQHGVDVTVIYPFSKPFAELDANAYLKQIIKDSLNTKHLVIGYDHRFGHNRIGNIDTLKTHADQYGYQVEEISAHDIDQITVSSTKIRKALEEGHLHVATEFLGHAYFIEGTVVKGKQLGRTIGYPTANLKPNDALKLIPQNGVYLVSTNIEGHTFYGMMNIGTNPTTDSDNKRKIEVHLFEFSSEIYGQQLTVDILERIRDEIRFDSIETLKKAIAQDEQVCRELISSVL